jgi:hypothetical protein
MRSNGDSGATIDTAVDRPIDLQAGRRAFLRNVGMTTAGLAMFGGGLSLNSSPAAAAVTDADILNFALNLEYLEAEFYQRAAFGKGLPPDLVTGTGNPGMVTGGTKVPFATPIFREYAEEIANDELAHVKFLRTGLGSARVARPEINLNVSFTRAARAAGLVGANQTFNAFANENNFLLAAFIFEDVGVTAYKGAARLISNKDFLEAAAGLLAVEAYHAAEIRTLLLTRGLVVEAKKISDLRDSVDGGSGLDQGIKLGGKANIVPTDKDGLAHSRSAAQVLKIVYLGGGAGSGNGFFPKKLNGEIR